MSIPETQLVTWANQGSITQSSSTYASIKGALEDSNAPYAGKRKAVYLQGSYGNHTNVVGVDSDIDIVCCLETTFQPDLTYLSEAAKNAFWGQYPTYSTYTLPAFKADLVSWLTSNYGADVTVGTKAIRIRGSGGRRNADVLPCINYRRYREGSTGTDRNYDQGIHFVRADGNGVGNFPVQHYDNCVAKHQATNNYFKRTVRIFKNMRNRLIRDGHLESGVAPSYFLEGMLRNVPNELFDASYSATVQASMAWLRTADRTQLVCANSLHWLIRENSDVSWNEDDFVKFLNGVATLWNDWYE